MYKPGFIQNLDAAEEQIIFYRTHLDIFIEDAFKPIKQTQEQHVIAREFGNCSDVKIVQNRGAGKTWQTAQCCHAMCCLYPGSLIAVCSGTAAQATLVLGKLKMLAMQNESIAAELVASSSKNYVQLQRDHGKCTYKNGSSIESFSIATMRGQRAKIVVIDECPEVAQDDQDAIVSPVKNYRREISFNNDFKDYVSKTVNITSACPKSNDFYTAFLKTTKEMAKGNPESFVCALDYNASVRGGITDIEFFMKEKETKPALVFDQEYRSIFVGVDNNSAFPYDLVQNCRTLRTVEIEQPKNSKSRYVISLDIATSEAKDADNSVISVIKFTERNDGSFGRKLVYMRSLHGQGLDILSEEIRKLYHLRFPNAEKIIYDARGLGDSLDRFFDREWVDTNTGKEYPPLIFDDIANRSDAIRIQRPFRAVQQLNQRLYTNMRVALEQKRIELPVNERIIRSLEEETKRPLEKEEHAIYYEIDTLQIEMGNIVAKIGSSGNVLYDTPRRQLHKDRSSSVAMGNDYISEIEKETMARKAQGVPCVGIATRF